MNDLSIAAAGEVVGGLARSLREEIEAVAGETSHARFYTVPGPIVPYLSSGRGESFPRRV